MPMTSRQLNRAMNSLRPGDVLTHLNCPGCQSRQILILARVGDDRYDFSVRDEQINIVRDRQGPWRWNEQEQVFRNKEGEVHDHIGSETEVLEGAGLRQLLWYRELPNPAHLRFRIDARHALGGFIESSTTAKMEAIINRSGADDTSGFAVDLQQAVDLIFAGSAEAVDERRMRYLLTLIHAVGHKIARNSRPSGIEDMLGSLFARSFPDAFGGGPEDLTEQLFGAAGRQRRDRGTEGSSGSGHDPAGAHHGH